MTIISQLKVELCATISTYFQKFDVDGNFIDRICHFDSVPTVNGRSDELTWHIDDYLTRPGNLMKL